MTAFAVYNTLNNTHSGECDCSVCRDNNLVFLMGDGEGNEDMLFTGEGWSIAYDCSEVGLCTPNLPPWSIERCDGIGTGYEGDTSGDGAGYEVFDCNVM